MPHLVVKNNITAGGALAVGQTLWLGGFVMTARTVIAPMMTSQVIKKSLHIDSEFSEQMDPMELASLNELLDRIAALGVATDYDRIGLKPDRREINSPLVTHHVAVVEEQCGNSSSILRTNYVRIPELSGPDTRLQEDITQTLNLESGSGPDSLATSRNPNFQDRKLLGPWVSDRVGVQTQIHPPTQT